LSRHHERQTRRLMLAGVLSVAGQLTAIAFMLRTTPYTTFAFMTFGSVMIVAGMMLFAWVMFDDLTARAHSLAERSFRGGEFVFRQGDAGDRIYVVKSGEVEVVRDDPQKGEVVLARLGKGAYFGEMALLSDAPRNASVRAATDVTALAIERGDFHSLFSSIPAFEQSIREVLKKRAQPDR
jgi:CRP-like cAMP-binding protein